MHTYKTKPQNIYPNKTICWRIYKNVSKTTQWHMQCLNKTIAITFKEQVMNSKQIMASKEGGRIPDKKQ